VIWPIPNPAKFAQLSQRRDCNLPALYLLLLSCSSQGSLAERSQRP
jgi:hypothetical protein